MNAAVTSSGPQMFQNTFQPLRHPNDNCSSEGFVAPAVPPIEEGFYYQSQNPFYAA